MPQRLIEIAGRRFGMLVVLARQGVDWLVRCDCGKVRTAKSGKLRSGKAKSCGCQRSHHGGSETPEYLIWGAMLQRCSNPQNKSYPDYGGRGILVAPRWRKFEAFLEDMGRRPSLALTIERINNDGHYELGNCRWATRSAQNRNKRSARLLTIYGRTQNLIDWANETGLHRTLIASRLNRGWSASRAVTPPQRRSYDRGHASLSDAAKTSSSTSVPAAARSS